MAFGITYEISGWTFELERLREVVWDNKTLTGDEEQQHMKNDSKCHQNTTWDEFNSMSAVSHFTRGQCQ